jgi:hypothetical protein
MAQREPDGDSSGREGSGERVGWGGELRARRGGRERARQAHGDFNTVVRRCGECPGFRWDANTDGDAATPLGPPPPCANPSALARRLG